MAFERHGCGCTGVTTGPGKGPQDFERMQRRHRGAGASATLLHTLASAHAWHRPAICPPAHTARAFHKRVEVCTASLFITSARLNYKQKYTETLSNPVLQQRRIGTVIIVLLRGTAGQ